MPIMSFAEYARQRDVSKSYISKIKGRGILDKAIIKKNGRPKIDSRKADKILKEVLDPNFGKRSPEAKTKALARGKTTGKTKRKSRAKKPPGKKKSGDQTFIRARTETEYYKAAHQKLDYKIKSGEFISKKEIEDQIFKATRLCRDGLLNIGPRVIDLIMGENNKARALKIVNKEVNDVLKELIQQLSKMRN